MMIMNTEDHPKGQFIHADLCLTVSARRPIGSGPFERHSIRGHTVAIPNKLPAVRAHGVCSDSGMHVGQE